MIRSDVIVVAAVSAFAGAAVSFLVTRRYYKNKYETYVEGELVEFITYPTDHDVDEGDTMRVYDEEGVFQGEVEIERVDDDNPYDLPWDAVDLDYDAEERIRDLDRSEPYVISKEEFEDEEEHYDKISLEYWPKEDVVLDDRNDPLQDVNILIGQKNLDRFGQGSHDRRVVYVRNNELDTDWEITMQMGSYLVDVLGLDDPTIEHSDDAGRLRHPNRRQSEVPKFRPDD